MQMNKGPNKGTLCDLIYIKLLRNKIQYIVIENWLVIGDEDQGMNRKERCFA